MYHSPWRQGELPPERRNMKFVSNAKHGEPVESGTIFNGKIGNVRITVHRIFRCEGWYLSCPNLQISRMGLKSDTLMGAIEESKEVLKKIVQNLDNDINSFCEAAIEISRY